MSDFDAVIAGIRNKVGMLIKERERLLTELERQKARCDELQKALENQHISITNLQEQTQITNPGNTLVLKGDSTEIKHQIAQLIQTIDDSLKLLTDTQ